MFTLLFWKATAERAVKTFAQAAAAALVAGPVAGILDVDVVQVLSIAGLATVLSVLTSVASGLATSDGGPSLTGEVLADDSLAHRHRDLA